MRTRQLSNILAGLNYLRAPVAGRRAVPIDLEIGGATMDLTTDIGFANALYHAANLREGAACMAAPVCGSFVFMSRGSTGRSIANPMGYGESCRIGNLLVSRTMVILLICAAKCVWFCLEQPGTSIMELHTLFQRFIKIVALRKLKLKMGDYGAPTLKPTILYSSHKAVDLLPNYQVRRRLVQKQMVKRYVDGKGKPRVCGGMDLKRSQAYPKQFGVALAACRTSTSSSRARMAKQFLQAARRSSNEADGRRHIDKEWRDGAELDSVIKFLTQRP
ncbi:Putative rhamnose biosynthetic enzyme 1 [Durusdinium trenchii]|uniref:Rhamnose biosynthetic enzyme 1 n=1 Tax=Durusdinium trenchii TaxID=1381693 RepID=A0ABP0IBM0_9DINO